MSAKDEFVNTWIEKIKKGQEYKEKFSYYKRWEDFKNYYRGKWDPNLVPVNRTFSYGRALIPRVYIRLPRVSVLPTQPGMHWHAKVVESIDNWLIRELDLKYQLKMAILDAFLCGVGVIKLGYDSEYGYIPEQAVDESMGTVTQVGRKTGERIEYSRCVKPGMPWALRVNPADIIVPWGATDPYSLEWVCHVVRRPLEDVLEDQKYNRSAVNKLKGTTIADLKDAGLQKAFKPSRGEADKYVTLYEIRDYRRRHITVIAEDQVLLDVEDELQIEDLPYEFLIFNPDPDHFWGIPDVAILEPQQKELNEINTQASLHRKLAILKLLVKKGVLTETQMEQLTSGEVGAVVEVEDDVIQSAVQVLQPHIPPDFKLASDQADFHMRASMGFSPNQLGEFVPLTNKTATEVSAVAEAFQIRVDERRDAVADLLVNIVRKWNQFIFKFWDQEKVIQVVGPQGGTYWVKYTGEQLRGEYFLTVSPEMGVPKSRQLREYYLMKAFELFNGDPLIDQRLLRKLLLERLAEMEPMAPQLLLEQAPETTGGVPGAQLGQRGERIPPPPELRALLGGFE